MQPIPSPCYRSEDACSSEFSTSDFQRCSPLLAPSSYLPHMLKSVKSLKTSRSSVDLCLAQDVLYLRPARPSCCHWEDEVDVTLKRDVGESAVLRGLVNVVSTTSRIVDDIRLDLVGEQRIAWPGAPAQQREVLRRTVALAASSSSTGVFLQRGVNSFEFSFTVPSSAPPTVEACVYGRTRYILKASIPGTSTTLKSSLSETKEVVLVQLPPRFEGEDLLFDDEGTDHLPWSGPLHVTVSAQSLVIGDQVHIGLHLPSPPATTTNYGVKAFVRQHIKLRSSAGETHTIVGRQRPLFEAGYLTDWQADEFMRRALRSHSDKLPLLPGRAGKDGVLVEGDGALHHDLRATTLAHDPASSGLRFMAELVVQVFFSEKGEHVDGDRLMIATVYSKPLRLLSARCGGQSLTLPEYCA